MGHLEMEVTIVIRNLVVQAVSIHLHSVSAISLGSLRAFSDFMAFVEVNMQGWAISVMFWY